MVQQKDKVKLEELKNEMTLEELKNTTLNDVLARLNNDELRGVRIHSLFANKDENRDGEIQGKIAAQNDVAAGGINVAAGKIKISDVQISFAEYQAINELMEKEFKNSLMHGEILRAGCDRVMNLIAEITIDPRNYDTIAELCGIKLVEKTAEKQNSADRPAADNPAAEQGNRVRNIGKAVGSAAERANARTALASSNRPVR